jgi:hypothetical protein
LPASALLHHQGLKVNPNFLLFTPYPCLPALINPKMKKWGNFWNSPGLTFKVPQKYASASYEPYVSIYLIANER